MLNKLPVINYNTRNIKSNFDHIEIFEFDWKYKFISRRSGSYNTLGIMIFKKEKNIDGSE
jgi:hypothetical protein